MLLRDGHRHALQCIAGSIKLRPDLPCFCVSVCLLLCLQVKAMTSTTRPVLQETDAHGFDGSKQRSMQLHPLAASVTSQDAPMECCV